MVAEGEVGYREEACKPTRGGQRMVGGGEAMGMEATGRRLTAEWTEEDQEETAGEQCQWERERLWDKSEDEDREDRSLEPLEQQTLLSLKPPEASELDEDEGFGDWSQKSEQRKRSCGAEEPVGGGERPRGETPEEKQAEDRSSQNACENLASAEGLPQAEVHLEGPSLSQAEPDPADTVGGLREAEEEHPTSQQSGTPSPLALEDTVEVGSPPLSPTTKLADRTESLNRSIEKSNSVKKSQPALPISKIDERLQQYTQATESAGQTPKLSRQPSIELPSMAVASTKNRWETGEVQAQSAAKTTSCQDIVAGDMSKKSLWEQRGGTKASSTIKSTPSGKRYKFVATGHGKYEKVLVDEGSAP